MVKIALGTAQVDLDARIVEREDAREHLTSREAALLHYLLVAGRTVSRDELHAEVWGYAPTVVSRAADVAVRRLRNKIEDDPSQPEVLLTVHGAGYRIALPSEAPPEPAPPPATPSRRYPFGDRVVDLDRTRIEWEGGAAALTGREVALFEVLLAARGASVERERLQRQIWGGTAGRALDNVVLRVRRKLEPESGRPCWLLRTANGYRLALPEPELALAPRPAPLPLLPAEIDRRFGRDVEIAALIEAFAAGERAVVLTGAAGVGKSRLALATAHQLAADGQRVIWVDADEAVDLDGLCAAMAAVLRVKLDGHHPIDALVHFLAVEADLTLVLDNLEQIPRAGSALGALIAGTSVRLLATSRVRLRLRGGRHVAVLPLPTAQAATLFAERAERVPRPEEHDEVEALVEALDGLPLAIELAAARTRVLSIARIREQLGEGLRLLADGPDRSMRASLDASWALAAPWSRAALCQLCTFEGRFSLEAAEAVLDLAAWPQAEWTVDVLQELCDASLLRNDPDEGRFWLLRVIREYASDKLDPEARAAAEHRHGRWFAGRLAAHDATRADVQFGPRRAEILTALAQELPDLLAALERAIARQDAEVAVNSARAAWETLCVRGPYAPAAAQLDRVLTLPLTPAQRLWAALLAGKLQSALGEAARAESWLLDARALAEETGESDVAQEVHLALAQLYYVRGQRAEARAEADLAIQIARRLGSWSGVCRGEVQRSLQSLDLDEGRERLLEAERIALAHDGVGLLASIARRLGEIAVRQGRYPEAERHLARALALGSGSEDLVGQMVLRRDQAALLRLTNRVAESIAFAEAAVDDCRRVGDRQLEVSSLFGLGWSLLLLGHTARAEAAYLRGLQLAQAAGYRSFACSLLNALGGLAAERTDRRDPLGEATRWFREALDVAATLDAPHLEGMSRMNLGRVLCLAGSATEGLTLLDGARTLFEGAGDLRRAGGVLASLAWALADLDRLDEARAHLDEALTIAIDSGDDGLHASVQRASVSVDARLGRLDAAQRTLAQLEAEPTDNVVCRSEILLGRAELAHARGDAEARDQALGAAAHLANPAVLGARFRALHARPPGGATGPR